MNVCEQSFRISHMCISQKVNGIVMWNLRHVFFSYEDEDVKIFSNLH